MCVVWMVRMVMRVRQSGGRCALYRTPIAASRTAIPCIASTSCVAFRQGIGRREGCRAGAWLAFAYLVADVRSYHSQFFCIVCVVVRPCLCVYAFDRVEVFEDGPENRILESTYYTRAARKIYDLADTAIIKIAPWAVVQKKP